MTAAIADLSALTGRDLRRDRKLAPSGENFPAVARQFLPIVHGTALALIPEVPGSAEAVSLAVFETLAHRWKRISRKTFLGVWLLRTTTLAVRRERRRLGLRKLPKPPLERLLSLKKQWQGPLLLSWSFAQ